MNYMNLAPDKFRQAMSQFATGVALVCARDEEGFAGLIVNSLTSVSLKPPLILWCLGKASDRFDIFIKADAFSLNILAYDQQDLARRFATPGGYALAASEVALSPDGIPLLAHAAARMECQTTNRTEAGDHIIILARIISALIAPEPPLIYHGGKYLAG